MKSVFSIAKSMKPILFYFATWAIGVLAFWLGLNKDAMGYSLLVLYIVLPAITFVSSLLIGKDISWGFKAWIICPLMGLLHAAAGYATFGLSNALTVGGLPEPQLESIPVITVIAITGTILGKLTLRMKAVLASGDFSHS